MTDLHVPAEVLAEPDEAKLAWAVIAPAYKAVNIYDGPSVFAKTMQPLTPGQRALLAIHWCVAEVFNGGFLQLFTNPTSVVAEEALAGLQRIGAETAAKALAAATEVLAAAPAGVDPEAEEFDEYDDVVASDALRDRLAPLEEEFYRLVDEEVYPLAGAYVRSHPSEFVK